MTELEHALLQRMEVYAHLLADLKSERDNLRRVLIAATEWADNQCGQYDTPEEWFVEARRLTKPALSLEMRLRDMAGATQPAP